jgi:1,4-alpha-glucan branching enzyme
MSIGSFCLVLHGHLPWSLHHGHWPHGEVWLFEAAAETYLPLLRTIEDCAAEGTPTPITLGLTPILLEQLASEAFQTGFIRWLQQRKTRATEDHAEFASRNDGHLAWLALHWLQHMDACINQFEAMGRDLPRAFADHARAGRIELLTSNATHGFMPLILHDACARAQVRAGLATSQRLLGLRPNGAWLPECAYRPGGPWAPPVLDGWPRQRAGVEEIFAAEGVEYLFLDASLATQARSEGIIRDRQFEKSGWDQATWDTARAWRSPMEPHGVTSWGGPPALTALFRHPEVSEQVWSGEVGYPGESRYLEFHKRHGNDGHRYWKVTGSGVDLGDKQPYHPQDSQHATREHARHLTALVASLLARHQQNTRNAEHPEGRHGVVVAPFDAELFGHWWHEGPAFLKDLFRSIAQSPVQAQTVGAFLRDHPPDKVVALPAGSWGAGGDFRVWLNDEMKWVWEACYRAEDRLLGNLERLRWKDDPAVREALTAAARELLLLQASDWAFVIHTRGAVDYGYRRLCEHLARFDRASTIAEARSRGESDTPIGLHELEDMALHDPVFPDLCLEWWQ